MLPLDLFCTDKNSVQNNILSEKNSEQITSGIKFSELLKTETDSVLKDITFFSERDKLINDIINKRALLVKEFSEISDTINSLLDDVNSLDDTSDISLFFAGNNNVKNILSEVNDSLSLTFNSGTDTNFLDKISDNVTKEEIKVDILSNIKNVLKEISDYFDSIDDNLVTKKDVKDQIKKIKDLSENMEVVSKIIMAEDTGVYSVNSSVLDEIENYLMEFSADSVQEVATEDKQSFDLSKNNGQYAEQYFLFVRVAEKLIEIPEGMAAEYGQNDADNGCIQEASEIIRPIVISRVNEKTNLREFVIDSYKNSSKEKEGLITVTSDRDNEKNTVLWSNILNNEKINLRGVLDSKIKLHDLDTGISAELQNMSKEEILDLNSMISSAKDKTVKRKNSIISSIQAEVGSQKAVSANEKEISLSNIYSENKKIVKTEVFIKSLSDSSEGNSGNLLSSIEVSASDNKDHMLLKKKLKTELSETFKSEVDIKVDKNIDDKSSTGFDFDSRNKGEHADTRKFFRDFIVKSDNKNLKNDISLGVENVKVNVEEESDLKTDVLSVDQVEKIGKNSDLLKAGSLEKVELYKSNQEIVDQIKDKIKMFFKPTTNEMKISLNPKDLGEIVVKLQMKEAYSSGEKVQVMNVSFVVDNDSVKDAILGGVDSLKNSLSHAAASDVENVSVMVRTDINQHQQKNHFSNSMIKFKKRRNFSDDQDVDNLDEKTEQVYSHYGLFNYQA